MDKLVLWEEVQRAGVRQQQHLACLCQSVERPVRVISSGDQLNLEMIVQGQHATLNYFKYPNALFEATYEFAHGPLCGPISVGPSIDGELVFPYPSALHGHPQESQQPPQREKCIWELRVAPQRDLWLHLNKAQFSDRSCDEARIEIYLAGRLEPRFIICPDNVTLARDLTILSAAELGAQDDEEKEPLPVLIQYTGSNQGPSRNAFRLVWTELFHLPRKPEGNAMMQTGGGGAAEVERIGS